MSEQSDDRPAWIALFSLRAAQADGPQFRGYRLLPAQEVLGQNDAVHLLADLPKPLLCSAERNGDVLEVTCGPIGPGAALAKYRRQVDAVRAGVGTFGGVVSELERGKHASAILTDGTDSLRCNASDLRRWQEQYVLATSHSVAVYGSGVGGRLGGPAVEILIGPSRAHSFDGGLPDDLPEELKFLAEGGVVDS